MRRSIKLHHWDNLEDSPNCCPILSCELDGVRVSLLIDTGASTSFLDLKFINKHPKLKKQVSLGKYDYDFNSLGGQNNTSKVLLTKNFSILSKQFEQEFKIMDLNLPKNSGTYPYVGILGFDFIVHHKITLNFKDFIITI